MRLFIAKIIHKKGQIQSIRLITISLLLFLFPNFIHSSCSKNEPRTYSAAIASGNANMPSGGTIVIQSLSDKKLDVNKLVDSKTGTKLVVPHTNFHVLWVGDSARSIDYYSITSSNNNSKMDPRSWALSGSNDNRTWTLLDEQIDQTFLKREETKEYSFYNNTDYKYYKLDINSNSGETSTQIAEWSLRVLGNEIEDLMQFAGKNSHSDLTPMGKFFEHRHETTEDDKIWLNDADKDAPLPDGDNRNLVYSSVKLYPLGDPTPTDANQRTINNCSAIAVFSSMAYCYPKFIKSIIKDNGNKTYTISMFDPQGRPIEVSINSKFLANEKDHILGTVSKDNTPNWSTILEKAMMKYNYIYRISRNYDLSRIGTEHVLPLFTGDGNSFPFAQFTLKPEDLARVVNVCLKQGKFVLGSFNKQDWNVDGSTTITSHVYTFMHSPNNDALFLMRNPWGHNPKIGDRNDGILRIPNNHAVAPIIDVRIVDPGIAAEKK